MPRPELFLVRGFGHVLAAELRARGWAVHSLDDHFLDTVEVTDRAWLEFGLRQGWHALARDARMLATPDGVRPLLEHRGVLFHLDERRLRLAATADRIHAARRRIERAAARGGPAAYVIGADQAGFRRTWRGGENAGV